MRVLNKAAATRTAFPDRPDPCDSWPIATLLQLPQRNNCDKDRGHTVNKAIIVSRHVGRRYPTTNQRNTKMIVIMMIMIIVIIIINIIMSMGLPNTPSRSKHAGGHYPTHTTPQRGKGGNHQSPHPNPKHMEQKTGNHRGGVGKRTHNAGNHRAPCPSPPLRHTDENDGDDVVRNDVDVLFPVWLLVAPLPLCCSGFRHRMFIALFS